jgi:phage anti-repressor protein
MGFSRKDPAKRLLDSHFTEGTDYKVLSHTSVENPQGGRPAEKILMNIKTFKKLCMKANTKKASDIHDYYITMEETLQQYINETYLEREQQSKIEQKTIATNTLVENFHLKPVNYFGIVGMVDNQLLGKFGYTNDIKTRIGDHRRDIGKHFGLDCIIECEKNMTLEKNFKQYVSDRKVTKIINGKKQTELIKLDDSFGPNEILKIYRLFKQTIETSISNEKELLTLRIELLRAENALKQTELETKRLEYSRTTTTEARRINRQGVSQYSLDGQLVKQHTSYAAAAKAVNGNRNTLAGKCRAQVAYKDYIWKCA